MKITITIEREGFDIEIITFPEDTDENTTREFTKWCRFMGMTDAERQEDLRKTVQGILSQPRGKLYYHEGPRLHGEAVTRGDAARRFWRFIHNAIVHPMLAFGQTPWVTRLHDWTARKWED